MKSKTVILSTLTLTALIGTSAAQGRRERISQLVPANIHSVVTDVQTGLRLVTGDDNGPFFAVERLERGRIVQQTFLRDITFADGALVHTEDLESVSITGLRTATNSIDFDIVAEGGVASRCTATIDNRRGRIGLKASCMGNGGGAPVILPVPAPVTACTVRQSPALGAGEWSKGLATDLDVRLLGGKITKYRILWSANQWTSWFKPGVNDVDSVRNPDGSQRRVWAYFTDHTFEIEICPATPQPGTGGAQPPPPVGQYRPTTEDIAKATATCKAVFAFSSEVETCVNQTVVNLGGSFPASAFKVVAACGNSFPFSSERQACLKQAANPAREPVELIEFCAKNSAFGSERLACFKKWSAQ